MLLLTASAPTVPGGAQSGYRIDAGYSAIDGHLVWGPINRTLTPWAKMAMGPASEGVYAVYSQTIQTWTAYSITNGTTVWTTKPYNSSWGYYDSNANGVIGYGNLYSWSLGGEVHCYDINTGLEKWGWNAGSAGTSTPYGTWPLWGTPGGVLADGKFYIASSHDYTPPVFQGAQMYCINATTGTLIWNTLDFGGTQYDSRPIADGILVSLNVYDNHCNST